MKTSFKIGDIPTVQLGSLRSQLFGWLELAHVQLGHEHAWLQALTHLPVHRFGLSVGGWASSIRFDLWRALVRVAHLDTTFTDLAGLVVDQGPPLDGIFEIFAICTLAVAVAQDARLETLTILLQAPGLLA